MALTDVTKNSMLTHFGTLATHVSLHTASPGTNGANEVTGGSPAYARKAVTWGTAAAGDIAMTGSLAFDVPPATTVTHIGYWSALSAGTFRGFRSITSETFAGQGTYNLTAATESLDEPV